MSSTFLQFAVGTLVGLGFELLAGARDVFSGVEAFWCWLLTKFLDFIQATLIDVIELLPCGDWFSLEQLTTFLTQYAGLNMIVPVYALTLIFLAWLTFQLIWIPVRVILLLIPGVW